MSVQGPQGHRRGRGGRQARFGDACGRGRRRYNRLYAVGEHSDLHSFSFVRLDPEIGAVQSCHTSPCSKDTGLRQRERTGPIGTGTRRPAADGHWTTPPMYSM